MERTGFLPFTINEKGLYDRYFEKVNFPISSGVQFSTLIVWMDWTEIKYKVIGEYLCFLCRDVPEDSWYGLPPLGPYKAEYHNALNHAVRELYEEGTGRNGGTFRIEQVKEWMLPYFKELHAFSFQVYFKRADSDYLYGMKEFREAMEKPRERYDIRHFIKYYNPNVLEFSEETRNDCFRLLEEVWCKNHDCSDCKKGSQKKALELFLRYQDQLELQGFLVYSKRQPVGYIGVVPAKTEVIFQIKKNIYGIRGLAGFMHKEAIERYCEGYDTVNYTEDMGRQGLRQYKEHLAPHMLSHNYVLKVLRLYELSDDRCGGVV